VSTVGRPGAVPVRLRAHRTARRATSRPGSATGEDLDQLLNGRRASQPCTRAVQATRQPHGSIRPSERVRSVHPHRWRSLEAHRLSLLRRRDQHALNLDVTAPDHPERRTNLAVGLAPVWAPIKIQQLNLHAPHHAPKPAADQSHRRPVSTPESEGGATRASLARTGTTVANSDQLLREHYSQVMQSLLERGLGSSTRRTSNPGTADATTPGDGGEPDCSQPRSARCERTGPPALMTCVCADEAEPGLLLCALLAEVLAHHARDRVVTVSWRAPNDCRGRHTHQLGVYRSPARGAVVLWT